MDKHTIITKELQMIAAREQIQVLYACESGSRAWGFASPDSDYDVRFIYAHPQDWYLSIDDKKDTLEFPLQEDLDFNGWDIRKALQLFRKSNAVIFEWLQSPVVYRAQTTFAQELRKLMPEYFSPRTVMHHHLGLVHRALSETAFDKEIKAKKYLYILRSLLSAIWVREHDAVPPMEFQSLTQVVRHNTQLMRDIQNLVHIKTKSTEKATVEKIPFLHTFIEQEFMECQLFAKSARISTNNTEKLNYLFRQVLSEVNH